MLPDGTCLDWEQVRGTDGGREREREGGREGKRGGVTGVRRTLEEPPSSDVRLLKQVCVRARVCVCVCVCV